MSYILAKDEHLYRYNGGNFIQTSYRGVKYKYGYLFDKSGKCISTYERDIKFVGKIADVKNRRALICEDGFVWVRIECCGPKQFTWVKYEQFTENIRVGSIISHYIYVLDECDNMYIICTHRDANQNHPTLPSTGQCLKVAENVKILCHFDPLILHKTDGTVVDQQNNILHRDVLYYWHYQKLIIYNNGDVYMDGQFIRNIPDTITYAYYHMSKLCILLVNGDVYTLHFSGQFIQIASGIRKILRDEGVGTYIIDFDGNIYDCDGQIIPGCQIADEPITHYCKSARNVA
jgi:hypothetical protein